MANHDWKEYEIRDNGNVRTVRARQSSGEDDDVLTIGGPVSPSEGDYVVSTDNPNVFTVLTPDQFHDAGFKEVTGTGTVDTSSFATRSDVDLLESRVTDLENRVV